MSSFTNSTLSVSPASCSSTGVTARQGPHHGAQKSTTTGFPARRTSRSKLASVTSRTRNRLQPPRERPDAQERHAPHGLEHDRAAHLRVALLAVGERDRHLDDAEARALCPVGRLDLEGVALRVDRVEVDGLEHVPAEALEPAGEVADPVLLEDAGVDVAGGGDRAADRAPVRDRAAGD